MGKVSIFNFVTLNGFYKRPDGDISWHNHNNKEESEFSADSANSGNILLFGRKTYEMMASFWPTPMAAEKEPDTAKGINSAEKIVFSKTLKQADWQNTRIVSEDMIGEVKKLKAGDKDMTILGSGSVATQLAHARLIDEFLILIDPILIDDGTTIFKGIQTDLKLTLADSRVFKSGSILLTYRL